MKAQHFAIGYPVICGGVLLAGALHPALGAELDGLAVNQLEKISSARVGRTLFEYEYKVLVANDGRAVTDLIAVLEVPAGNIQVIDGSASFAQIEAGSVVRSDDTILLRVDRRTSIDLSSFTWSFDGTRAPDSPFPADPGEEGLQAIEGIDVDGDGVRDDVQRVLLAREYATPEELDAMRQAAIADQAALLFGAGGSPLTLQQVGNLSARAGDCLWDVFGLDSERESNILTLVMINTPQRSDAIQAFAEAADGSLFARNEPGDACE